VKLQVQIHRTRFTRDYLQVPNQIARRDTRLSMAARGLLVHLLSLPPGAASEGKATVAYLCTVFPDGRKTIANAMNLLVELGYVKRAKVQDPDTGLWVTLTSVTDTPESPSDTIPTVGSPTSGLSAAIPTGEDTRGNDTPPTPPEAVAKPEADMPAGPIREEGESSPSRQEEAPASPELISQAVRVLERLGLREPRLFLSDADCHRLAPRVVPWLRDGFTGSEIIQTLCRVLPDEIESAPALVVFRLRNFRPEREIPSAPRPAEWKPAARKVCDGCEALWPLGHPGGTCRTCQDGIDRALSFLSDPSAN
jgi:hypothetical protein